MWPLPGDSIVLAFINITEPSSKDCHGFPKETVRRGNGTFKPPCPILPFLCSRDTLWVFVQTLRTLVHSVLSVYAEYRGSQLMQPLSKLTLQKAKEVVVSLPGSFWKAPLISSPGNWHSGGWKGQDGILGISHPPHSQRKEQIMQILETSPLATSSAPP